MSSQQPIQRALLSTANKTGLVEFAKVLVKLNIEIIATGGTAICLQKHQIAVTEVADYTGFPEIMEGRVKTLHPKIHGGILGRRNLDNATMEAHNIPSIDLVVVNLYPFQETISNLNCSLTEAIEKIDIGGPSMLRAGAKNFNDVTTIVDPNDYSKVLHEIQQTGTTSLPTRLHLAQKAFAHSAQYDTAIANYLSSRVQSDQQSIFPPHFHPVFYKAMDLRYGENPHQAAAVYADTFMPQESLMGYQLLQGKPLSFNNVLDSDCAATCAKSFSQEDAVCVIVKHVTPCGVAVHIQQDIAYKKALAADPESAFGGVIAFNTPLTVTTARLLLQQFTEVVLAPGIDPEALTLLSEKTNLRILIYPKSEATLRTALDIRSISGGLLMQEMDSPILNEAELQIATHRSPTLTEMKDLLFAWHVVKFVKSNAIVYAKDQMTLGIGAGQTSRVFSAKIGLMRAQLTGLSTENAVMASDGFFPFADSIEFAAAIGITAIIQPGGSKRDAEVIAAANSANITMVLTGTRHFRH